jgi:hypothetical protein
MIKQNGSLEELPNFGQIHLIETLLNADRHVTSNRKPTTRDIQPIDPIFQTTVKLAALAVVNNLVSNDSSIDKSNSSKSSSLKSSKITIDEEKGSMPLLNAKIPAKRTIVTRHSFSESQSNNKTTAK